MIYNWLKYNPRNITQKISLQTKLKMIEYKKIRKQKDRRRRRQGEKYVANTI